MQSPPSKCVIVAFTKQAFLKLPLQRNNHKKHELNKSNWLYSKFKLIPTCDRTKAVALTEAYRARRALPVLHLEHLGSSLRRRREDLQRLQITIRSGPSAVLQSERGRGLMRGLLLLD